MLSCNSDSSRIITSSSHSSTASRCAGTEVSAFGNHSILESVKEDIDKVTAEEMISAKLKQGCKGFILEIKTGKVSEV